MKHSQLIGKLKTKLRPFGENAKPQKVFKILDRKVFEIRDMIFLLLEKKPKDKNIYRSYIAMPEYLTEPQAKTIFHFLLEPIPIMVYEDYILREGNIKPSKHLVIISYRPYIEMAEVIIRYLYSCIDICLQSIARQVKLENRRKRKKNRRFNSNLIIPDARKIICSERDDIFKEMMKKLDKIRLEMEFEFLSERPHIKYGLRKLESNLKAYIKKHNLEKHYGKKKKF